MILPFKVTKSHQKAMSKVRTIVCCSKFYQNDFRDKGKASRREALASYNSSISIKSFKMFIICEICLADHLKVGKKGVTKAVSSLFAILCNLFLSQIWSYESFLSTGTWKGTNINSPANLRKFHLRKRNNALGRAQILIVQQILGNSI